MKGFAYVACTAVLSLVSTVTSQECVNQPENGGFDSTDLAIPSLIRKWETECSGGTCATTISVVQSICPVGPGCAQIQHNHHPAIDCNTDPEFCHTSWHFNQQLNLCPPASNFTNSRLLTAQFAVQILDPTPDFPQAEVGTFLLCARKGIQNGLCTERAITARDTKEEPGVVAMILPGWAQGSNVNFYGHVSLNGTLYTRLYVVVDAIQVLNLSVARAINRNLGNIQGFDVDVRSMERT